MLMKSAYLAALLLFVSKASAYDTVRLLRGISDLTTVDVQQDTMHDLGQGEPPDHQEATSADAPLRQLAVKGRHANGHHHPRGRASRHHPASRQRTKGAHPSHRAPPGSRASRHAPHAKKQRMNGSSQSSTNRGHWADGSPADDWAPSNVVWVDDDYYDYGGWSWGWW